MSFVESTGVPEAGARHAYEAIQHGKTCRHDQ